MDELLFGTSAIFLIGAVVLIGFFVYMVPLGLWITAFASGVYVPLTTLVGMRLRKVRPPQIIHPLIAAAKAGIQLDINALEAHYLAGGQVRQVVNALISADKASINLNFQRAAAIDLAGRSAVPAVPFRPIRSLRTSAEM